MKLKRYRIVRDSHCGYSYQIWKFFWPFWVCGYGTFSTIEEAENTIEIRRKTHVVKYIHDDICV